LAVVLVAALLDGLSPPLLALLPAFADIANDAVSSVAALGGTAVISVRERKNDSVGLVKTT